VSGPQFSVILPVYNGEAQVSRAVDSVRYQTDSDWEVVAVDDGSTDGSYEILRESAAEDERIRIYRTRNSGGPAHPRNRAIAEARGQNLCFLDQDDYWLPQKLEAQRPLLERPEVGLVYGDAWVDEPGTERRLYSDLWGRALTGQVTAELISSNFVPALTAVVPAPVARAIGPLDERLVGVDDYHWWLRVAMAGYRFEFVADPVAVYCVSTSNLSRDHDLQLDSLELCLRDLSRVHPLWRGALSERRESVRLHAFDYFANRLATNGVLQRRGLHTAVRVARLARGWHEMKRAVASALPPTFSPSTEAERAS
jgi:teichuronic acid biosynthesis glycosyltransferase TuaG